jgi:opacity protein-like surface antigen
MRSRIRVLYASALASALMVLPAIAADYPEIIQADPVPTPKANSAFYFGVKGGAVDMSDAQIRTTLTPAVPGITEVPGKGEHEFGFTYGAVVGYDFGQKFGMFGARAELEIGYTRADLSRVSVDPRSGLPSTIFQGNAKFGSTSSVYGMVNGYIDAHLGWFTPYITAGVGMGRTQIENHGIVNGTANAIMGDNARTQVVYQAGIGAGFDIDEGVVLDVGYRFMNLGSITSGGNGQVLPFRPATSDFVSHQLMVGLRYKF